jgi:tungstate transport system ATP-binding protein
MNNLLEGKHLKFSTKGQNIIDIEHIYLKEGEIVSLIGANGAGKTTLLLTLSTLLKLDRGNLYFMGMHIGDEIKERDYRKNISLLFQENLFLDTTVFENVAIGLRFRKCPEKIIEEKVKDMLKLINIYHLKDRNAKTLSGGEAKRVCIARALVIEPKILFLDEPFTNLDTPSKEEIIKDTGKIIKNKGISSIIVTHDKYEALSLSDRIIVMEKGKIIQEGTKEEVLHQPKNNFVACFFGVENILKGKVIEQKDGELLVDVCGNIIEVTGNFKKGTLVYLFIRPENVFLYKDEKHIKTSVRNHFRGKIVEINNFGYYYRITIDCKFTIVSYITKSSFTELSLNINDEVIIGFKATSIHVTEKI